MGHQPTEADADAADRLTRTGVPPDTVETGERAAAAGGHDVRTRSVDRPRTLVITDGPFAESKEHIGSSAPPNARRR